MVTKPVSKIHELESIYEHAPLGLAVFDTQLRFVRLNQQIAAMNGIPAEAHLGRTIGELLPDVAALIEPKLQRVLESGEPIIDYELIGKTPATGGKSRIWIESYFPMRDTDGNTIGVNVIVEDITQQREYEEALCKSRRESERQKRIYETILDNTPDPCNIFDLDHRFTYANQALLKILGRTLDEVIGKTCREIGFPEGHAQRHDREIEQIVATRQPVRGEVLFHGKEGRRFYEYIFVPVFGANGEVEAIAATTRDVTDRKEHEEALKRSEAFTRSIFESTKDCLKVLDLEGRMLAMNEKGKCALEIDDFTIHVHTPWIDFWHGQDRENARKAVEIAAAGGSWEFEGYFPTLKTKIPKWWSVVVTPIMDSQQHPEKLLAVSRDITGNKQYEKALKAAAERAEAANQAKTDFLANMSHEIRTPMNAVVGITDILQRAGVPADKQREMLEVLHISAKQLMELINDMLDIAKLESRSVILEHIPFDLENLVAEIVTISSVKAQEKDLDLKVEYGCGPDRNVMGDPLRLKQVLLNLVGNAVKFTPQGSVRVQVSCLYKDDRTADVQIDVVDTGIGIPQDKLGSIFSKFSQADSSITRQYGGSGLGLSITRNLVELMGGTISVESEVGKGSRFRVTIPFQMVERHETDTAIPYEGFAAHSHAAHVRILLVEDNKANIIVATSLLGVFGYAYDVAKTGEEALKKLQEQTFDLILMDVQMPGMDGYQITGIIRQQEAGTGRHIPIIGVTANVMQGDREKCLQAGMDGYIAKPFEARELKETITEMAA